ncbi:MAG TPA: glycoside hydrolase family 38 C-terminal domain-containing protein [Candidatus Bathyarchaeia archaeon]|nr:glycoside hydrolase family 38 C-terminal domain-containing protein [Candidatus Bathyarchaeia archaeon]
MTENEKLTLDNQEVFIVPSTHWDREWYKPFQEFRFQLVHLVDELLSILAKKEYYFTLDGQTIVLEDFLEIRPEKKDLLVELVQKGKIAVGPWYLLPDEWLVGQESLIRNLETSFDLAKDFGIPLMKVGYLPDQFGHTKAIPQILSDLTDIPCAVIWRGVGPDITKVPFYWKSHEKAKNKILCNYLPEGYGNAASLTSNLEGLNSDVIAKIQELKEYSPLPLFLLMNGTDHTLPQTFLIDLVPKLKIPKTNVTISLLENYIKRLIEEIKTNNTKLIEYVGEFRSPYRAPLLQDTYSARMWIKQWDNKVEDFLVHYVEPICSILQQNDVYDYPDSFITLAWKWLLKNQPHDSICGCSVDETHNEMIARYSWAESITTSILNDINANITTLHEEEKDEICLVFNPTNNSSIPTPIEFQLPTKTLVNKLVSEDGLEYQIQPLKVSEEILFENTFRPLMIKTGIKMLPGRKIIDVYVNEIELVTDEIDPKLCHVTLFCNKTLIGDLDIQKLKEDFIEIVDSGKYKKFHVKATLGTNQSYVSLITLKPWSFTKLRFDKEPIQNTRADPFIVKKNSIENKFYKINFLPNGSIKLYDKKTKLLYSKLHIFEDWGDRGDEYTYSRVGPEQAKMSKIKRKITNNGPLLAEITQSSTITTFEELTSNRTKRKGKVKLPVKTIFKFYRDNSRIDISTTLTNTAKDHRLRICFDLPFESKETITSTHFGYIKREGNPIKLENYTEMPTGIQAQKRFIRIEDENKSSAFTLFNKGLPEVELVDNSRVALTLIRAIGYLSRQDFPERPLHAGPFMETPGAQELNKTYTFNYSLQTHIKDISIDETLNQAEAFALPTKSYVLTDNIAVKKLTTPLLQLKEPMIKISSIRIRDNELQVLVYNLKDSDIKLNVTTLDEFKNCKEILIDSTVKKENEIKKGQFNLEFAPFEIKLLRIS